MTELRQMIAHASGVPVGRLVLIAAANSLLVRTVTRNNMQYATLCVPIDLVGGFISNGPKKKVCLLLVYNVNWCGPQPPP